MPCSFRAGHMFLLKKIKELEQLKKEVPLIAKKIIQENKKIILDLIREDQLFDKGIDGKGARLKEYTSFTIAVKRGKQQPTNRTTLFDTGSFFKGFDLLFTDQYSIGVFSTDSKTPDLIGKYGSDIFTFTTENNKVVNEQIVLKQLIEWMLQTPTFTQI